MASKIQLDSIQGNSTTAVSFSQGVTIPSSKTITANGMNVSGTLTANSFVGDGTGITGITFATVAKTFAFSLIAG